MLFAASNCLAGNVASLAYNIAVVRLLAFNSAKNGVCACNVLRAPAWASRARVNEKERESESELRESEGLQDVRPSACLRRFVRST